MTGRRCSSAVDEDEDDERLEHGQREEKCAERKADGTDGRAADAEADDAETGMN